MGLVLLIMERRINKSIVAASMVAATLIVTVSPILLHQQLAYAVIRTNVPGLGAPIATSGDNVYITWWTNKTGSDEVMFKASTDNGKTFGDKLNLSNSSKSESVDAQIAANGDHVYVTWWERNRTSNEPVLS
jgi:hypothetical protein